MAASSALPLMQRAHVLTEEGDSEEEAATSTFSHLLTSDSVAEEDPAAAGSVDDAEAALSRQLPPARRRGAGGQGGTSGAWGTAAVLALTAAGLVALAMLPGDAVPPGTTPQVVDLDALQGKAQVARSPRSSVVDSAKAKRARLLVEEDLGALVTEETLGRSAAQIPSNITHCARSAWKSGGLFDAVLTHTDLGQELADAERDAFKARFLNKMERDCREDPLFTSHGEDWLRGARNALEGQKPVMTKALALSVNRAGVYEFFAEMRDWMLHESVTTFEARLGRKTSLPDDAIVSVPSGRQSGWYPQAFNSAQHWPHCKDQILRIHNQGNCGSCWSFSCTQVLDARVCIESEGKFAGADAKLSPGYFASCAARNAHPGDGCAGGWEFYCYMYIDRYGTPGAVSENCSPYYAQRSTAPACAKTCQAGYSRTLAQDGFKTPGVGNYRLLLNAQVNDHAHVEAKLAIYRGGSVNHGIHADRLLMSYSGGTYNNCEKGTANHAVLAYGWFKGGYLSKNSWGESWGEGGLMRIADCVPTDFTIPGDFQALLSHIPYPLGNLTTL